MHINDAGLELLKSCESCSLTAYRDSGDILTIGYGHTGQDVTKGLIINQEKADALFRQDLERFEDGVSRSLTRPANENQFSAMVCFAYNVGLTAFRVSTLLKQFNLGDLQGAADQFPNWDMVKGQVIPGLVARRAKERALFLAPCI